MNARRRLAVLAALAVLSAGAVGAIAAYSLYRSAVIHHGEFLSAVVRSHQTFAVRVFHDELGEAHGDTAAAIAGTLEQLRAANRDFVGFGETGEFTVARRVGDTIVFELGLRGDSSKLPDPVALPSLLAAPVQRALSGDFGVSEETDYRGVRVLAAYAPVEGTGLAIAAKMDVSEIRAPHLRAAGVAFAVGSLLLLLAMLGARGVAQRLLAEVEEREDAHRALLEDFPGIIFRAVSDESGGWRFQVLEGAVEEITGVAPEANPRDLRFLRTLVHPGDLAAFDARWMRFLSGEAPEGPVDYRMLRPDGSTVWLRVQTRVSGSSPGVGSGGMAVSGVVVEATAERRALEVRERAEAELHALVKNLPGVAVHILDRDLRYLYSGGAALANVGLTHEDLVGKHIADVLDPELARELGALYGRVLAGATDRSEGSFGGRAFEVTAAPLAGPEGSVDRILVLSLDVTEQRRQAAEAATAEARFHAFMEASPAAAWIKDADGRHVWVNGAWERAFGVSRGAWEGTTDHDHLPAALADETRRQDLEVLRLGQPFAVIEDTVGQGGARRTWQVVKFPLSGLAGEPQVAGIAVDITKERASEAALRESEDRLRLAVAAGGHGLWDLDLRTGAAQVDDAYARMLGYDPATFVETNPAWRDRLHPDDQAAVYAEYEAYVEGKRNAYRVEFRSRTADGEWRWVLSQGEIVERDADGRPVRMMGTHTDIQALKDAEAALRESEDRFRRAVETSPDAIFIHTGGCFAYLNPAALTLFGAERPEQLLGTPVLDRHTSGDRSAVAERMRILTQANEPTPSRAEGVIRPDGTEAWAEFTGVPFRYKGEDGGLVFARDVTERVRADEQLRERLEELRRWQAVMLDREDRVQDLKREVNELCRRADQPPRYATQATAGESERRS